MDTLVIVQTTYETVTDIRSLMFWEMCKGDDPFSGWYWPLVCIGGARN